MRRSLLFIPGNNPGMVQNSDIFDADAIIFDLEDAVLPQEKDAARTLLHAYFKQFPSAPYETIVRINTNDSSIMMEDLSMCLSSRVDAIMVPKATKQSLFEFLDILVTMEHSLGISPRVTLIPIIETARAVWEAYEIVQCPRVSGVLLGAEDLSTDLGIPRTASNLEILVPRSLVVLAAKAVKIDAIDTPFLDVDQEASLRADAEFSHSIGMNAKACIHPLQVGIIHEVFSPTSAEIRQAQKLLLAEEKAKLEGKGAFSVDGKMVDKPILERAHHLLEKAKVWGLIP